MDDDGVVAPSKCHSPFYQSDYTWNVNRVESTWNPVLICDEPLRGSDECESENACGASNSCCCETMMFILHILFSSNTPIASHTVTTNKQTNKQANKSINHAH
jgi:hypothetical protein